MNYETFKGMVEKDFLTKMPEEYSDYEIRIIPTCKVNKVLDGMTIWKEGTTVSPTIYINHLYEMYRDTNDFDFVLTRAANYMLAKQTSTGNLKVDFSIDKVIPVLVNTKWNTKLLEHAPHRSFLDLSVVYHVVVNINEEELSSFLVNNAMLSWFGEGINEEQLYKAALDNTVRLLPAKVRSMQEVIRTMFGDNLPQELEDAVINDIGSLGEPPMIVLTNEIGVKGASVMLYPGILESIADKLEQDICILPSSIHEVLAIPAGLNPLTLQEMIEGVNENEVAEEERLSDHAYYFDRATKTLKVYQETVTLDSVMACN